MNAGTWVSRGPLPANRQRGRQLRPPKLTVLVESSDTTACGGLALAASLVARLKILQAIEDIAGLQHSEAVRRMLGAARIPDPTTVGDFLHRFNGAGIDVLDGVTDEIHRAVWRQHYGRKTQTLCIVDIGSHVHHVSGN